MKIYVESVFLLNFLLDFMILYGTKRLLKRNANILRLLFGSVVGSLTTLLLYIKVTNLELGLIKIGFSILMNYLSFGKKEILKNIFYFYMISIIIGGSIFLLNIKLSFYKNIIYLIGISFFTIKLFVREYKKYKVLQKEVYKVKITLSKKTYEFEGFIDTGNQLKSPISQKSIILVELDIPKKKSFYIPYKALNTEGILEVIKPDKVVINEKEIKSCLIGLSKDNLKIEGCNCILPNSLKEEL